MSTLEILGWHCGRLVLSSEAEAGPVGPGRLTELLELVDSPSHSAVEYVIGGTSLSGPERETAAQLLAEDAVRIRCGTTVLFDRWKANRDGGPPLPKSKARALAVYLGQGFGLPGGSHNEDHLQGMVAELLWNRLVAERVVCRDGRRLVYTHPIKVDTLEPGGDGLVIYKDVQGTLVFRLWEIKKHDAVKPVSATIHKAAGQLASRGQEYLAKLAGPETFEQDGELGEFYTELVEIWLDGGDQAGVGVSVGTSADKAPRDHRAFGSLSTAFPQFPKPGQVESIVIALPDFPAFARRVREIVWTGL